MTHRPGMRLAVVRVSGAEFDSQGFATRFGFRPDLVWRAGEPDGVGRVRQTSGFKLTIADEASSTALVRRVCEWVNANRAAFRAVESAGATAEIDVGLSVGASSQFFAAVTWAPSELRLPAECGVGLCFSAYPGSGETESESAV